MLPAAAWGQFPTRGGGFGRPGGGFGRSRSLPNGAPAAMPTSADLTKEDPILVLLANKASLSLADSQVTELLRLDAELVEQNRPLLSQVDSLNAATPKRDSSSGRGDQASPSIETRRAFANAIHEIRENDRAAMDRSLALLDDKQREKAEKLLESEREKREKNQKRSSPLRP
jgi:hypothetical protein